MYCLCSCSRGGYNFAGGRVVAAVFLVLPAPFRYSQAQFPHLLHGGSLSYSDLNSHRGEAIYAVNTLYRQDPSSNFEEKDIYKVSPRQPLGFPLLILLFY
jgi:hypothetical protein